MCWPESKANFDLNFICMSPYKVDRGNQDTDAIGYSLCGTDIHVYRALQVQGVGGNLGTYN